MQAATGDEGEAGGDIVRRVMGKVGAEEGDMDGSDRLDHRLAEGDFGEMFDGFFDLRDEAGQRARGFAALPQHRMHDGRNFVGDFSECGVRV